MSGARVLCLAWGAVVALLAYPATAQIIGQESGILGGNEGFLRPTDGGPTVTIAAMPFTRTVTCTGSYTLTGTSTGSGAVTWSSSPSGESGSCTGTDSWSCVVAVSPDAVGEGTETVTISRGGATATQAIGFYVAGAHSCFLSQNLNGTYNSGVVDNDAVTTWVNLGSSAKNVTQAVAGSKPTYRTGIVGGQPVVRCDGGDRITGTTASDWDFMVNDTDKSVEDVWSKPDTLGGALVTVASTVLGSAQNQHYHNFAVAQSYVAITQAAGVVVEAATTGGYSANKFYSTTYQLDDDGGAGIDLRQYLNGIANGTSVAARAYGTTAPAALALCATAGANNPLTGDLFRVVIYQSALTATQRGINKAVDEWALGGTLPVTP